MPTIYFYWHLTFFNCTLRLVHECCSKNLRDSAPIDNSKNIFLEKGDKQRLFQKHAQQSYSKLFDFAGNS